MSFSFPAYGVPPFPGGDAGDDVGAVLHHLLRVKRSFAAGDPLDDETG